MVGTPKYVCSNVPNDLETLMVTRKLGKRSLLARVEIVSTIVCPSDNVAFRILVEQFMLSTMNKAPAVLAPSIVPGVKGCEGSWQTYGGGVSHSCRPLISMEMWESFRISPVNVLKAYRKMVALRISTKERGRVKL